MSGLAPEDAALQWLMSFADLERGVGWNLAAAPEEQWRLGRTRALLDLAGTPDRGLTCVLVAGTKGKGSTAAFLASILGAAGQRVGLYTQPHLQAYRERVRVDGAALTPAEFAAAVERIRPAVARLRRRHPTAGDPTTFEITTVLALDCFARMGCTVAVVEVGLGGRLDATNAIEPALSLITPISRDHTAILGRTLAAIAGEKAGIMRRGRPVLLAAQRPTAARALRAAARRSGARPLAVPPLAPTVRVALRGEHQRGNAALAVAAARALFPVSDRAVARGLARLRWPGRFEVVRRGPRDPLIVLDGAHNGASARVFAVELRRFAERRPIHLIVGAHKDKDIAAIFGPLLPLAATVVAVRADSPRALDADAVAAFFRRAGARRVQVGPTVLAALGRLRSEHGAAGTVVAVTGSLALVGEARDALGLPVAERLWAAARS